ncbi:endonuclease III [candidate division WOR-3 bacterium]|uniref:Endonuclease III n=1 Tax=candidate division WOR-3 bacterium TaxID=2052148 RepID=A0A9D5K9N1_UNCW3|nr:endonuclease III [candidate division WOR-3 bacterium]MBD3365043.1 endonuclease III [candidate division WOR-3 bacterium]
MRQDALEKDLTILRKVTENYEGPIVERQHRRRSPFRTLVSVLLSARTKDEVTGPATDRLFKAARTPQEMAGLSQKRIEELIYPVGFYKTKAKHIKQTSRILVQDFCGKVPETTDELLSLPGIGLKSANLMLGVVFGKPAICVDTHVHRITNRWGYVKTKTPAQTEQALRVKLPRKYWVEINRLLVIYGQNVCTPISPYCSECKIKRFCNKTGVTRSR